MVKITRIEIGNGLNFSSCQFFNVKVMLTLLRILASDEEAYLFFPVFFGHGTIWTRALVCNRGADVPDFPIPDRGSTGCHAC